MPTCISIDPSFLAFPAFLLFPSFFSLKRKGETRDLRPVFQRALTRVSRIKAARNIHTPLLQSFSSYFLPYLKHFALVETYIKCKNSSLHFHCASTRLLFNSRGSRRLTFSLIGQPAFYSSSCSTRSLVSLSRISISLEGGSVATINRWWREVYLIFSAIRLNCSNEFDRGLFCRLVIFFFFFWMS